MRNPLTYRIESYLGAILVLLTAGFFVSKLLSVIADFNTDTEIQTSGQTQLKIIPDIVPETERVLIDNWVRENNVTLPPDLGYRYIIRTYPDRPWLK